MIDIRNASIRAFNLSNYEQPPITIYNRTVSTFVTGLGVFNYTHRPNLQPFIEFMIPGENNMTQIPITVQSFFQGGMMPNMSNETNSTDNSTSGDNSTSTENSTQVNATTEAVFAALEAI